MDAEKKNLRKMSRSALLELLVEQSRKIDRLTEENESLREKLADAIDEDSHSREAALVSAALLKVNTVLENAERAAARLEGKCP